MVNEQHSQSRTYLFTISFIFHIHVFDCKYKGHEYKLYSRSYCWTLNSYQDKTMFYLTKRYVLWGFMPKSFVCVFTFTHIYIYEIFQFYDFSVVNKLKHNALKVDIPCELLSRHQDRQQSNGRFGRHIFDYVTVAYGNWNIKMNVAPSLVMMLWKKS